MSETSKEDVGAALAGAVLGKMNQAGLAGMSGQDIATVVGAVWLAWCDGAKVDGCKYIAELFEPTRSMRADASKPTLTLVPPTA